MKPNDTTLTPLEMIRAIGEFDFDPCGVHGHPTAKQVVVWPDDGLAVPWHGIVWCNPPYSDPLPWMRRMAEHGNGVALVLASTDTAWFQELALTAEHYLFLRGRPAFHRLDRSVVKLMRASTLVGWGEGSQLLRACPLGGLHLEGRRIAA